MTSNTFLRFIAIVLIANSHLDDLYPISALGTGGSIGNALFFMLSGYGLFLSEQKRKRPFPQWYKRRILRIYPSIVIASILLVVIAQSAWRNLDWLGYVKLFIWPTNYWFIAALMIFYLFFFIILKSNNYKYFLAGIILLIIPYLYFYLTVVDLSVYSIEGPGYFKWIFYLQTMFLGGYLANRELLAKLNFFKNCLALVFFIGLYYGILIYMGRFGGWQFQLTTHLLMFPILFLFLKVSQSRTITLLVQTKYIGAFISLMSLLTLEIYLLHGHVRIFPFVRNMIFPLNIVVFWMTSILLAYILNKVAGLIKMREKEKKYSSAPIP